VDKDPTERTVIITPGHDVNTLNSSLAEDCLEHILNIAPADVVESARNADARLSDKGRHIFQCGSAFDAVERKRFQFFLYFNPLDIILRIYGHCQSTFLSVEGRGCVKDSATS